MGQHMSDRDWDAFSLKAHCQADPHFVDNSGTTALLSASKCGRVEIATYLTVSCQVDICATRAHRSDALVIAARCGHLEILRMLVERQADVHVAGSKGSTPLRC